MKCRLTHAISGLFYLFLSSACWSEGSDQQSSLVPSGNILSLSATEQTIKPLPNLGDKSQKEPWSLAKASQELVKRLIERKQEVIDLQANLQELEQALSLAETQLLDSQSTLERFRMDLKETSSFLKESQSALTELQKTLDDTKATDKKALDQARAERDLWMIISGVTVAVGVTGVLYLFAK